MSDLTLITNDPYRNLASSVLREAVKDYELRWDKGLRFWVGAAGLDPDLFKKEIKKAKALRTWLIILILGERNENKN